jgi:methionine sulfoxide reductase heme-binding subunit
MPGWIQGNIINRPTAQKIVAVVVHIASLLPLAILTFDYFSGHLAPNPAQTLEVQTGRIAVSLLTATLLVSPLARLLKLPALIRARRPLGIYSFFYVALHLSILVGFDYRFDLPLLLATYGDKPFTWFGLIAGLILAILALTSFDRWKCKLGKWWRPLHRLVYLAAILDLAHFFLAIKGNLFTLSGNLTRPLLYAGVIGLSFLIRLLLKKPSTTINN